MQMSSRGGGNGESDTGFFPAQDPIISIARSFTRSQFSFSLVQRLTKTSVWLSVYTTYSKKS